VEKPKGKRPLGRPTHKLENNIKINLIYLWFCMGMKLGL
jgi:hypothetical protein